MGIFLLFIPLAFFIIIEGVILYFLISMIVSALLANNYSTDAIVGNSYPAGTAIIYVVVLTAAVGLAIYLYIRLAVWPAVTKNRRKKEAAKKTVAPVPSAAFAGGAQTVTGGAGGGAYMGNNGLRVTGIAPAAKKKSKAPLVIIIAALVLILGFAAYLFIARPAWLPFELPALPFLN